MLSGACTTRSASSNSMRHEATTCSTVPTRSTCRMSREHDPADHWRSGSTSSASCFSSSRVCCSSSSLVGPWSSMWTWPRAARAPTRGPRNSCAVHARARSRLSVRIFAQLTAPRCVSATDSSDPAVRRNARWSGRRSIATSTAPPAGIDPARSRPAARAMRVASRFLVDRSCRRALTPSMDRTMPARFTPTPRAAATNHPQPERSGSSPTSGTCRCAKHTWTTLRTAPAAVSARRSPAESSSIDAISRIVRSLSGCFRALCTQPDIDVAAVNEPPREPVGRRRAGLGGGGYASDRVRASPMGTSRR